jgi:hypothetical protein
MINNIYRIPGKELSQNIHEISSFANFLKNDTYLFLRTYNNEGHYELNESKSDFENIADATIKFLKDVFSDKSIMDNTERYIKDLPKKSYIVPVHGYIFNKKKDNVYEFKKTKSGSNLISLITTIFLSEKYNINYDFNIRQSESVSRNASCDMHRFMFPTTFEGTVTKNRNYVVLDDHIKTGSTIANLVGHIHKYNSNHVGIMTLAMNEIALKGLSLNKSNLDNLNNKFSNHLDNFSNLFGYDFSYLTDVEASMLSNILQENLDPFNRLSNYRKNPENGMFIKDPMFKSEPIEETLISLKELGLSSFIKIIP